MNNAYNEMYLSDARKNMGEMLYYAADCCGMDLDAFFELFIASGLADLFGRGFPRLVCGLTGTELVHEVLSMAGMNYRLPKAQKPDENAGSYLAGFLLADYQWYSLRSFDDLFEVLPPGRLIRYASNYQGNNTLAFRSFADDYYMSLGRPTRLQTIRRICGYSQRTLSEKSGVHLRSIQQYEQRSKDINKAGFSSVAALARALGCSAEDLLEAEKGQPPL